MEQRVSKAERMLSTYAKRSGMSEEGKQWLMCAVDPFHDKPLSISGYPDGTAGKSVVQCVKLALDISRPASVALGSTWDCLIVADNFLNILQLSDAQFAVKAGAVCIRPTPTTNNVSGGLKALTGPVGSDFSKSTIASPYTVTSAQVPDSLYQGKFRVLSQGFEVSNTTNELSKNGSVTVFEINQVPPLERYSLAIATPTTFSAVLGVSDVIPLNMPPASLALATQIPGAKTWEAKDGAYCVCRQNTLDNPATRPFNVSPIMVQDVVDYPQNPSLAYMRFEGPTGNIYGAPPSFPTPFHGKCAYFTNLSDVTTLHVNMNIWVERFPTSPQFDLCSLATESCDYDPIALEAWSTISAQMPAGVAFAENGFGDWFTGEVASLIDSVTGTKFATGIDKWQKEKWSPSNVQPVQNVNVPDKRQRMNDKAAQKNKSPKQGPMLPNGGFAENKKNKKKTKK